MAGAGNRVYNNKNLLFQYFFFIALVGFLAVPKIRATEETIGLMNPLKLRKYVDELPDMPRINGYDFIKNGNVPVSRSLKIGMFQKNWVSIISVHVFHSFWVLICFQIFSQSSPVYLFIFWLSNYQEVFGIIHTLFFFFFTYKKQRKVYYSFIIKKGKKNKVEN